MSGALGFLFALPAAQALAACSETWTWNSAVDGWTGVNCTISVPSNADYLKVLPSTSDAQVISPAITFTPSAHDYMRINIRSTSANGQFQIYYTSTAHTSYSETYSKIYNITADGQWHYYTIPLSTSGTHVANSQLTAVPGWTDGTITRLRLDPARASGGEIDLDFVVVRQDTRNPDPPSVTAPSSWTNTGPVTVTLQSTDPAPTCTDLGVVPGTNPDIFASGVWDFGWHVDTAGDLWEQYNNGSNAITGVSSHVVNVTPSGSGPHVFYVVGEDRTGRDGSAYTSRTLLFDNVPPGAPGTPQVVPGGWSYSKGFNVSWAPATDDNSGISRYEVSIDGGVPQNVGNTTAIGFTAPSPGSHSLRVRAVDVAGNAGPLGGAAYAYYDPNPPAQPSVVTVIPDGNATEDQYSFSWSGASDALSGVCGYYYAVDDGGATFTTAASVSGALAAGQVGSHLFHVWTVDCAGNVSAEPRDVTFRFFPQYVQPPTGLAPTGTQAALPSTFSWNATGSGHRYYVQVSSDSTFATAAFTFYTDVPWFMIPAFSAPVVGQSYSWRVMTTSSYPPNWSQAAHFTPYVPPPPPPAQVIGQEFPSGEVGEGVNTSLGAVTRNFTILTLRGPGGEIALNAWYSSIAQRNSLLGSRWNWTLGQLLTPAGGAATVTLEDNQDLGFTQNGPNYVPALGIYDSLATVGSGYVLVRPSRQQLSFDAIGTLQQVKDRNANAITLHYSGGVLTSFDDQAGRNYTVTLANSRVSEIHDAAGRTWRFDYDGAGYLSAFTDAKGARTQFQYDAQGRLTLVVDPLGHNAVQYTYDGTGRVSAQTDVFGKQTSFTYDDLNRRTTVTNPLGRTRVHVYDADFRLIQDIDELENTTTYTYDANHNRIATTDALGHTTGYSYDPRGNVYLVADALRDSTRTVYDYNNQPVYRQQPYGKTTVWRNDAAGNPIEIDEPLGKTTFLTYNGAGQVTTVIDANGHPTSHLYDGQGNRTRSTDGAGGITRFDYDGVGRRTGMTDAVGIVTHYSYDADDSLVNVTNGANETTSYAYDANGNRTVVTDPLNRASISTYDNKNRLVRMTDALRNVTEYSYDELDQRITTTDPRGKVTSFAYDEAGRMFEETDPLGAQIEYNYDAVANRTGTTDQRGNSTLFIYDALNRLITTSDALNHVTQTAYDSLGRVVSERNQRGYVTLYGYDPLDRLTSVRAPTGGLLQYGYDPVGNRLTTLNANGHTTTMTYDGANRLLTSADPLGNTQHYFYDAAGHRIRRVDARNRTTLYLYDGADRLTRTIYDDSTRVLRSYDAAGNLTAMTDLWGTSSYTYDSLNRVVASTDDYGQPLAFSYDPNGNLASLGYPGGQVCQYHYDPLNRMTSVTDWNGHSVGYGYDPVGNNTQMTYPNGVTTSQVYDVANRLTSILTKTPAGDTLVSFVYTLDENGNRTRIVRVDKREDPQRLGGPDVYGTSAALSSAAFPSGADSVVLASGDSWEEAVGAPQAARQRGVPALIVPGDNLWASTAAQSELSRLKGIRQNMRAVVLGDIAGLSPAAEAQLEGQAIPVRRIRGSNRFDTAVLAAAPAPTSVAVLLGGRDAARAGAAALVAARWNAPLLLTERDSLPAMVRDALSSLNGSRTILIGDATTIGAPVASWLNGNGHSVLKRYDSSDPASISVAALEDTIIGSDQFQTVRLANKDAYPDILSAAADPSGAPTLLCQPGALLGSPDLLRWIGRHKGRLAHAVLLGPESALSSEVQGQLRTVLRTTITQYTHSPLDELTSEIIPGVDSTYYSYDPVGNRASITQRGVQTTYGYDTADQLIAAGPVAYSYDANGNRITRTGPGTTTYTYDFENRLLQIVDSNGTSVYRYDGSGRRIRSQEPVRTTRYTIDPTSKPYRALRESNDAGVARISYAYGLGLVSQIEPGGGSKYYHHDGLGSTAAMTDSAGGDVAHRGFTGFGEPLLDLGTADSQYGYVGRYGVEASPSGLLFMRERFYDQEVGAFLSRDPETDADREYLSGATYLYAAANPTLLIDADGRWWHPSQAVGWLGSAARAASTIDWLGRGASAVSTVTGVIEKGVRSFADFPGLDIAASVASEVAHANPGRNPWQSFQNAVTIGAVKGVGSFAVVTLGAGVLIAAGAPVVVVAGAAIVGGYLVDRALDRAAAPTQQQPARMQPQGQRAQPHASVPSRSTVPGRRRGLR